MELLYEWRGHYDHGGHGKCDCPVAENGWQLRVFEHFVEHAQYLDREFRDGQSDFKCGYPSQRHCNLCRIQPKCNDYGRLGRLLGSSRPV